VETAQAGGRGFEADLSSQHGGLLGDTKAWDRLLYIGNETSATI
jgi:hypothetical protein